MRISVITLDNVYTAFVEIYLLHIALEQYGKKVSVQGKKDLKIKSAPIDLKTKL